MSVQTKAVLAPLRAACRGAKSRRALGYSERIVREAMRRTHGAEIEEAQA